MTKEEAIQILKRQQALYGGLYATGNNKRIYKAFDMAIEALSEPSLVRCRECRYYSNNHLCEQFSRFGSVEPLADFYCGFGERREP